MDTEPLLHVENVTRVFGSGDRRFTAIKDVSFNLGAGEYVALLGPSGSGKSTLLRMVTGLIAPTAGTVYYRGKPVRGVNPHATMVFQGFALYPWLTVQANVALALEARAIGSPEERRREADRLLDLVGLDGFQEAYPRELSGGMRQKVGFARALALQPELLCLDEPFSALDVLSAEALRGEFLELWTTNRLPIKAILMVSHNIEEAVLMADRILVMAKEPGRIVAEFPVKLPHPRSRKEDAFEAILDDVYSAIAGRTEPETAEVGTAPGTPGPTRILPHATPEALAGMLEYLNQGPGRFDVYRLDDELGVDMTDLMQTIDMAEMLGFASVGSGDIQITPLGQTFAEASILTRKEIFGNRARRLPMMSWIMDMLRAAPEGRLPWKVFYTALLPEFPDEVAERQLDVAIDWGRYGELIAYDDREEMLSLEPESHDPRPPNL